jgi:hypothetical protein
MMTTVAVKAKHRCAKRSEIKNDGSGCASQAGQPCELSNGRYLSNLSNRKVDVI